MKHVIIGTAGHVDHGKTLLIKALTGIDTDRLQEEKKRGITIELGFAHIEFENGTQAGIVDVPGHEKFIRNMLAGAGGIDLAMLIVAADEGFMPQTVEHLGILSLLGIKDGLVVITKTDMVEPLWTEMMVEEVRERVRGTFLEGKPIVPVSAYTGDGLDVLRIHLQNMVATATDKNMRVPFRLPIDRIFSVDGFGTVVTGTLIEGCMHIDDAAELMPSGITAKIRNLQVHGADVRIAYAGQRVAVNLAGVKKSDVTRGDTVAKPGTLHTSMMIDVRLENLRESHRTILNGSQVHLFHGSSVALSKVVLLDRDELRPGESCFAQLRLSEPMAVKTADRFVVRFYSPLETIGGGVILDDTPAKHKRNDTTVLASLQIRESGSVDARVLQAVQSFGCMIPTEKKLSEKLSIGEENFHSQLLDLVNTGHIVEALPGRYISSDTLDSIWADCTKRLQQYHMTNPLHAGMKAAELRQKVLPGLDVMTADAIFREYVQEGKLRRAGQCYALTDFTVQFSRRQIVIRDRLLAIYRQAGQDAPATEDVAFQFQAKEKEDYHRVLESLLSGGDLVMLSPQIIYDAAVYRNAVQAAETWFVDHDTITLTEYRDVLQTSRKYALALLEHFDRNKMTKKDGDLRRWGSVRLQ